MDARPKAGSPDSARELDEQLHAFEQFAARTELGGLVVQRQGSHQFVLRPPGGPDAPDAPIDLVLMALTHGDERGGLAVLNAVCGAIDRGEIRERISLGFVLANVAAARAGVRFLERDMNRCYGRSELGTAEDRRAREIEPTLRRARHCIDLHQTIEPTLTPFFVAAFHPRSLSFACAIDTTIPIVTHWGGAFSASAGAGCTSDEFVQRTAEAGVSIELGRKGFDVAQCEAGTAVCTRAIAVVADMARGRPLCELSAVSNPIHSWAEVVLYPPGDVQLTPGLKNFQTIAAGETLGLHDGVALTSSQGGTLLFPKYVARSQAVKPAELYRLLRRCDVEELLLVAGNQN